MFSFRIYSIHGTYQLICTFSGKKAKDRVTVMFCTSMTGEKSELFVVGKSKSPRCFQHVKKLPVRYRANANALMTSSLFIEWLAEWDRTLRQQGRKILLLVDTCPVHKIEPMPINIEVCFMPPPNTTSILQPCD